MPLFFVITNKYKRGLLFKFNVGVIFLFLVLVFFFYKNILLTLDWIAWMPSKTLLQMFIYLGHFFSSGGERLGGFDFKLVVSSIAQYASFFIFLILFFCGAALCLKKSKVIFKVLSLWLIVPVFLIMLISMVYRPIFLGRHLINLLPVFLLFVSYALSFIFRKQRFLFYAIFVLILTIQTSLLYAYYSQEKRMPIQAAAEELRGQLLSGESVVCLPEDLVRYFSFFLHGEKSLDFNTHKDIMFADDLLRYFENGEEEKYPKRIHVLDTDWFDGDDYKEARIFYHFLPRLYESPEMKTWKRVKLLTYSLKMEINKN